LLYEHLLQGSARAVLQILKESDSNKRYNTGHRQYVLLKHDYKRGERACGGVHGYRHLEGALMKITPWINSLKKKGSLFLLLQDRAPAHKSRISRDSLIVEYIEWM
jgi:hypothetical protein